MNTEVKKKDELRKEIAQQTKNFLLKGGKITKVVSVKKKESWHAS